MNISILQTSISRLTTVLDAMSRISPPLPMPTTIDLSFLCSSSNPGTPRCCCCPADAEPFACIQCILHPCSNDTLSKHALFWNNRHNAMQCWMWMRWNWTGQGSPLSRECAQHSTTDPALWSFVAVRNTKKCYVFYAHRGIRWEGKWSCSKFRTTIACMRCC